MSRKRLSWDAEKVAEIQKQADPYTMNQTRQNPPVEKYQTGDPDTWAETPNMATPWKGEGRTETGHPAPAREAVTAARKMEDKALKCVTIARRMLPGADQEMIEDQATELMLLTESAVNNTLQRQASLAESIVAGDDEDEEDEKDEGEGGDTTDASEVEAKGCAQNPEDDGKGDEKEVDAGKATKDPEEEEQEVDAGKAAPAEEEEKSAGKKKPDYPDADEKKPTEADDQSTDQTKEADDADLLDKLFEQEETTTASESKQGAKKLSGIVKQASDGGDPLADLWEAPPDVSKAF